MYTDGTGRLVVSATDLVKHLACAHVTTLDRQVADGLRNKPDSDDELLDLLFTRGLEHEEAYRQRLADEGRTIIDITIDTTDPARLRQAEAATVAALEAGADVVYQGTFFDGRWRGHADFLLKRPDRPGRWGWSYDVADTKLARRLSVAALLQMAVYADRLEVLQGVAPGQLIVVTGDRVERPFALRDCAAYTRLVRDKFLTAVAEETPTVAEPVSYCAQCRWRRTCRSEWRAADDLSLVAFMRRDHARALREADISTVRHLAASIPDDLPPGIGAPTRHRLTDQARLQIVERDSFEPVHETLPPEPSRGFELLPEPSPGDVFFDIEGDPFASTEGLEYLWGLLDATGFTPYWAHTPAEEKQAVEAVVDHLMAAWAADPGMHVYHYAAYERTRLTALTARYSTREDEVDQLLRGGRLVDLYTVVRQGLRVSKESYSIKELEHFYRGVRRAGDGVSDALGSVVAYERWVAEPESERDQALLDDIEDYNRDDCDSTRQLQDWLEGIRTMAGGDAVFPRPVDADGAPSDAAQETSAEVAALQQALHEQADTTSDETQAVAYRLLADLLDWHRREARPEWWEYFRRQRMDDDELVDDSAAIGGLHDPIAVDTDKRSTVWRMTVPPQDTKLGPGETAWVDPRTDKRVTVVDAEPEAGWLTVKRATHRGPPPFTAIAPGTPIDNREQRARLRDLARWATDNPIDDPHPSWRAARSLLLREPPTPGVGEPRLRRPGEDAQSALDRLSLTLGTDVLPVQGPPGTGKTYAGARTILDLVAAGQRVGICAFSHKAITNLLDETARAAAEAGVTLAMVQKARPEQGSRRDDITVTNTAPNVEAALDTGTVDVVAGTSWLFARQAMQGSVDVLVVDEAGQMSLANVLAVTGATRGLVLLGDPQQLAQPVTGTHPTGAQVSVLEHLLDGHATIPDDRGLLLDVTRRMHPAITQFISAQYYDGRLTAHADCAEREVRSASLLGGVGLRYVPVEHVDNSAACSDEADVVARLVAEVLGDGSWAVGAQARALTEDDILVLAPYNAHVHRLRARLSPIAPRVRVGTVDKFQGQEAPVVVYSMASSSVEDAPRGVEFLYDAHRFNVAISRAQAVAAIVCSPALLTPLVRTPDQLAVVNALNLFTLATANDDDEAPRPA